LLETERPRLLALVRRLVGDPHTADDVVQDATVAALRALPRFEGRAALGTWIHRIVTNAALMHLRRARGRPAGGGDALAGLADGRPGPADNAAVAEEKLLLGACLERLFEDQRNVVELRDIRGLDTRTTAAVLGISPNAVKIRLHRARRALRDLMVGEGGATVARCTERRNATTTPICRPAAVRAAG